MKLEKFQLTNFRNFTSASLTPSPELSVITGRNGSGKSSLIEAIHYLGFGRSFRTSKHHSVIKHEQEKFSIFAQCNIDESETSTKIGLERGKGDNFVCSINGEHSNRLSSLVSQVPVQLFTPQSTDLVIGTPGERRRFCDWGLFHVEHSYQQLSKQYSKLLHHRNALLKQPDKTKPTDFVYWDQQLCLIGDKITHFRENYISQLKPVFESVCSQFLPEFSVEISYYKGWDKDSTFEQALIKKGEYDRKIGHTSAGPHKADLRFKVNALQAQEILSRGQLRMAVAALQLSQTKLFRTLTHRHSIFLLDDVGAELDIDKRERFIDGLLEAEAQVFVTAIEKSQLSFIEKYKEKKMFHVEHGHVNEE